MQGNTFWWFIFAGVAITIICTLTNNMQHHVIKTLVDYYKSSVKKYLIQTGEADKARNISLTEVPKLEVWMNESQNYSLINMVGMAAAVILLICGGIYHSLTYIIILSCGFMLGVNLLFLPRALARLIEAAQITTKYSLLISTFEQANEYQQTKENKSDGGNSA